MIKHLIINWFNLVVGKCYISRKDRLLGRISHSSVYNEMGSHTACQKVHYFLLSLLVK